MVSDEVLWEGREDGSPGQQKAVMQKAEASGERAALGARRAPCRQRHAAPLHGTLLPGISNAPAEPRPESNGAPPATLLLSF